MMTKNHYPMKSDVREKKDAYLLEIDLPGCRKEDIQAYIEDGYLHVNASLNRDKEKGHGRYLRRECFYGEYHRSFYVGSMIDENEMKASYHRGVLKLTITKKTAEKIRNEQRIAIEG